CDRDLDGRGLAARLAVGSPVGEGVPADETGVGIVDEAAVGPDGDLCVRGVPCLCRRKRVAVGVLVAVEKSGGGYAKGRILPRLVRIVVGRGCGVGGLDVIVGDGGFALPSPSVAFCGRSSIIANVSSSSSTASPLTGT
ncbi:MAG TPA: hypothetical protein VJ827_02295, partial [Rubrobacter sp.]|nr:hypothetical protein [Rubrobacter sp.]